MTTTFNADRFFTDVHHHDLNGNEFIRLDLLNGQFLVHAFSHVYLFKFKDVVNVKRLSDKLPIASRKVILLNDVSFPEDAFLHGYRKITALPARQYEVVEINLHNGNQNTAIWYGDYETLDNKVANIAYKLATQTLVYNQVIDQDQPYDRITDHAQYVRDHFSDFETIPEKLVAGDFCTFQYKRQGRTMYAPTLQHFIYSYLGE